MDLQKANAGKRFFAFLLDVLLLCALAVGVGSLVSGIVGFSDAEGRYDEIVARYSSAYGVDITADPAELTPEQLEAYQAASAALEKDAEAEGVFVRIMRLSFVIEAVGVIVACAVLEFAVPLFIGDGRTLGKWIFGLGVMRRDWVKIPPVQVFIRAVIGKGVCEILLPLALITLTVFGFFPLFAFVFLLAILLGHVGLYCFSGTKALIHDFVSATVVVDWNSQRIFPTAEDRDRYLAEKADADDARSSDGYATGK